jgi:hypothetical protein
MTTGCTCRAAGIRTGLRRFASGIESPLKIQGLLENNCPGAGQWTMLLYIEVRHESGVCFCRDDRSSLPDERLSEEKAPATC